MGVTHSKSRNLPLQFDVKSTQEASNFVFLSVLVELKARASCRGREKGNRGHLQHVSDARDEKRGLKK